MNLDYSLCKCIGLNEWILMELNKWATLAERLRYWLRHYQQRICKKGWDPEINSGLAKTVTQTEPEVTSRRAKLWSCGCPQWKIVLFFIGVWGQVKQWVRIDWTCETYKMPLCVTTVEERKIAVWYMQGGLVINTTSPCGHSSLKGGEFCKIRIPVCRYYMWNKSEGMTNTF